MTFSTVFLIIGCFVVQQSLSNCTSTNNAQNRESDDITDYYWREYTGVIPSDALPGGTEKSGKKTYIGQMYSPKFGLLPATIYQGSKSARASGGGTSFSAEDYVKILCTRNHERYQWIATRNAESQLLINYHLVVGGTEAGFVLNIGRVNHETAIVIGKVFASHTPHKGLSIPHKEREAIYQSYEILTYQHYANVTQVCAQ